MVSKVHVEVHWFHKGGQPELVVQTDDMGGWQASNAASLTV